MERVPLADKNKPLTVALLATCYIGEQVIIRIAVMTDDDETPSREELDSM